MSATIPKRLYVTVQYRSDVTQEHGLLGFASPYTKDKNFEKRKHTQDKWAYGVGVQVNIDDDDEITVSGESPRFNVAELFMTKCYPRIIDNTPIIGFQISKNVRRHGWHGPGNVVWRISDPRGFDLEISSDNFARIIDCATLENGVIKEACVWGREGSKNILLPITSDVYRNARTLTDCVNNKVNIRDVNLGDTVILIDKKQRDGLLKGRYLGRAFYVNSRVFETDPNDHRMYFGTKQMTVKLRGTVWDRYNFELEDGSIYTTTKPVVSSIETAAETPLTEIQALDYLNQKVIDGLITLSEYYTPYMAVSTEAAAKKISVELEQLAPFDATFDLKNKNDQTSTWFYLLELFLFDYQGKLYLASKPRKRHKNIRTLKFYEIDRELLFNDAIILVKGSVENSQLYGGALQFFPTILDNPKIDDMIPYRVYLRDGHRRVELKYMPEGIHKMIGIDYD